MVRYKDKQQQALSYCQKERKCEENHLKYVLPTYFKAGVDD